MIDIIILFASGILGILAVNLVEIDQLNQSNDQPTNLKKYVTKHWANMALSVVVVTASIIGRASVQELQQAGKWLMGGMFAIGMCAPTVVQVIRQSFTSLLASKFKQ